MAAHLLPESRIAMSVNHTISNQYHSLRARCLAESTRVFNARGKSVKRCEHCQLADYACICQYRPGLQSRAEFILLMHRKELFKPTNTGRLIADALPRQTHVVCWSRTEPCATLLSLLGDPQRRCLLVFPDEAGETAQAVPEYDNKINTYILLDGTWKQSRRMFKLSPWLKGISTLAFPESLIRGYSVRKSEQLHQLSTVEAGALCLQLNNEHSQAQTLLDYFGVFNQHYLATRGCYVPARGAYHDALESIKKSENF